MLSDELKRNPTVAALAEAHGAALLAGKLELGQMTLEVDPEAVAAVCRFLKEACGFNRLSSVTAVDHYPTWPRFELVYHLHSLPRNERLRLKCRLAEDEDIETVSAVWRSANWYEREVYDLFGVRFRNHPDLRRILMPEDWEGHPLRKDYPVHGYKYSYPEQE